MEDKVFALTVISIVAETLPTVARTVFVPAAFPVTVIELPLLEERVITFVEESVTAHEGVPVTFFNVAVKVAVPLT